MDFEKPSSLNFIHQIIESDLKEKKSALIQTRFPPEPNGYLHIGHAKAICINFNTASKYNGFCNLRFDDTNPEKESAEYVSSIQKDIRWLGFNWTSRLFFASDYFKQLYDFATELISRDLAYVCEMTQEEIRSSKGTPTRPGVNSPFRDRAIEENLSLFSKMKEGLFDAGKYLLRAKIDMSSPNMHMRDPVIYRIKKIQHHRTGDKWCIYPMYDFTHCLSDYLEGISHSLCSLEFEVHRPLYNWFLEALGLPEKKRPQQIEFARLNLSYTVLSKRKLLLLINSNFVNGWDDPRLPTLSGLRRRGYTPDSIKTFIEKTGVAKRKIMIDVSLLEHCLRDDLNKKVARVMSVLNPLKVVITNYPDNKTEVLTAVNNPEDDSAGKRKISFSKELYIEQEDFMEEAPKKFFRLSIGKEVRLRYAYFITCTKIFKDKNGKIIEVHCTYDPLSKGGKSPDGRKVKGTLHWIDSNNCIPAVVNLYDRLFLEEAPGDFGENFTSLLNPKSLIQKKNCLVEPFLKKSKPGNTFQFERLGYFCLDKLSSSSSLIFNRAVALRDTWSKQKR